MSTADIEPLNYRAIIFKIPPTKIKHNRNKDYSLNINDSGDIMDDDDDIDEDDRNS